MNNIKQVLIRLSQKESIRLIASALHVSKNTVSRYKAISEADSMSVRELIALEDTVLNHRFNDGNPAYCGDRMEVLKELLSELENFHISQHIKAVTPSKLFRDSRGRICSSTSSTASAFSFRESTICAAPIVTCACLKTLGFAIRCRSMNWHTTSRADLTGRT